MPSYEAFYHQEILDALRIRICTLPPTETLRLRENDLSAEFGVSRSPIRQVLQILARQHLVAIKPSVGASAVVLRPDSKSYCFQVYRDIAGIAASLVPNGPIPQSVTIEMASADAIVQSVPELSPEIYVTAAVKVQAALATMIDDQIIQDSMLSSIFRLIRWRVDDLRNSPDDQSARARAHFKAVAENARGRTMVELFQSVAGVTDKMAKEARAGL